MNPWFAAMIPLAIILVLGSIAFLIGYKGYLSNDDGESDGDTEPSPATPRNSLAPRPARDTASGNRRTHQAALHGAIVASDRMISRASHERAVLVQFIDLYAPGTLSTQEFLANLRTDYARRVTFATRHLPSSEKARLGSAALEAADRQGRFLPFLEALTLGPDARELSRPSPHDTMDAYVDVARKLRLDIERFEADLQSSDVQASIDADRVEAARAGVTRAPALILLDDQNDNPLSSLADVREAVRLAAR